MSKIITQDTFNDVVNENIQDFDMEEEEAITEAVQQFEAQGVNLSNIIKNPKKSIEIINLVEKLHALSEEANISEAEKTLNDFRNSIKGDISCKLLAAKKGVYSYLLSIVKKSKESCKVTAIEVLTELLDGYPDLLDAEGLNLLLGFLDDASVDISIAGCKLLQVSVQRHEKNRASMIKGDVAEKLRQSIERWPENEEVTGQVCAAVLVLIQDDDVRVVHGDAHEHARALASKLLPLLAAVLSRFVSDLSTTTAILSALTAMIVRNEFCIQFHDCDGLKHILDAMVQHPDDQKLARECFLLLKALAGSDEVKEPIIASGAAPLLVASLEKHYKNNAVAVAGCMCLAALSLRSPKNSKELVAAGCAETLVRCMTHWKNNKSIMKHGCAAIRNQISRCEDLKDEYLQQQVPDLLLEVKSRAGELEFEAKSVLVDLGCDVKLTEEWRGTGVQLTN